MKHNLKISVSKNPQKASVLTCKKVGIRERLLRFLLGDKQHITVLIPGDRIKEVAICESLDGGEVNG